MQAPMTDEDVQKLFDAADVRFRAFLGLAGLAGQSTGQVLSLQRRDVDLDASPPCVTVRRSYQASRGDMPRSIELERRLADYLRAYVESTPHLSDDAPLFPGADGTPLTTRWAQRIFARLCRRLGFGPVRFRDLRRAHIGRVLAERYTTPRDLREELGVATFHFMQSVYGRGRRIPKSSAATPQVRVGRPPNTERDAELVRMMQEPSATYATVALRYNQLHPPKSPKKPLTREAVRKAVKQ